MYESMDNNIPLYSIPHFNLTINLVILIMFKNFSYLYNKFIDYFLYKALKKKLKKHINLYPNISARVFDIINLKINLSGRFENSELITLRKKVFNKINSKNLML